LVGQAERKVVVVGRVLCVVFRRELRRVFWKIEINKINKELIATW